MKEYLDLRELAEYSSISVPMLRTLLKEIPHIRLQRKIIVKQSDFDYWANRRKRQHRQISPIVRKLADEIMRTS